MRVTCGSSHGLSRRLGRPLACCTGWAEGLEAIHPYSRVVLVWYMRGESEAGSYVGCGKQVKQATQTATWSLFLIKWRVKRQSIGS